MLLEYIARYYKFLWLALIIIASFKIIVSYSFNEKLRGLHGIMYGLFKWYDQEEQEVEDNESRRVIMRLHNIITLFMYFVIALLIICIALPRLIR